jgi:uncharacterized membrane protein YwaF
MKFQLWSFWHFLYILSSFIIFLPLFFLVRKRSEKTKNITGIVMGAISIFILVLRNVDIFIANGWDLEVIPLQVCHIGSIIAGLALITKKKWVLLTAFCFNLLPAILAMVFADALANYETILRIRPQTYIWGHILIVVCALYGLFIYKPHFEKRDLIFAIIFVAIMAVVAIICNSAFRTLLSWQPNYFYLYDYTGTPLKFLYNVLPSASYGWFTINWFYTIVLFTFFVGVFILLYFVSKLIVSLIEKQEIK